MSEQNNGGIWVSKESIKPDTFFTEIIKSPTHFGSGYFSKNGDFILHCLGEKIDPEKVTFLKQCSVVEKADADKLVEALEYIYQNSEDETDKWAEQTAKKAITEYNLKYNP